MTRHAVWIAALAFLNMAAAAMAQQAAAQPTEPARIDAKKEVIVNWTVGDQAWSFKDILTAYEPVKGHYEPRGNEGTLAVWKLRLVKDFEGGAAKLHEEMRGTPFKVVALDADRTIIDPDLAAKITVLTGKMDDTIELYVALPDATPLKEIKMVRVQRRTDVGF